MVLRFLGAAALWSLSATSVGASDRQVSHYVVFDLRDDSTEARRSLIDACKQDLAHHEGIVSFSVGNRAANKLMPANDTDFDVVLHIVFADEATHDAFDKAHDHMAFIIDMRSNWTKVRVFDSYLEPASD